MPVEKKISQDYKINKIESEIIFVHNPVHPVIPAFQS